MSGHRMKVCCQDEEARRGGSKERLSDELSEDRGNVTTSSQEYRKFGSSTGSGLGPETTLGSKSEGD